MQTGWMKNDKNMLKSSQIAIENHPSSFDPERSFILPNKISKKKKKADPKKPPRNVVSGDNLKTGRNTIIKIPVTVAQTAALLSEDWTDGNWEDIFFWSNSAKKRILKVNIFYLIKKV